MTPGDEFGLITEGTDNGATPLPPPAAIINYVSKPSTFKDGNDSYSGRNENLISQTEAVRKAPNAFNQ